MQQQLAEIDGCELEDEDVAEEDAEGEDELLGIDEDELRELEAEMEVRLHLINSHRSV